MTRTSDAAALDATTPNAARIVDVLGAGTTATAAGKPTDLDSAGAASRPAACRPRRGRASDVPGATTTRPVLDPRRASLTDSPDAPAATDGIDCSGRAAEGEGSGAVAGGAGCSATAGGVGAGGEDAGGAAGAGGGLGALRGGSNSSGSTYVSAAPTRMPRWIYGTSCSTSPVGPGPAIASPSTTLEPLRTRNVPRCVREALYPSPVTIVTVSPWVGTWPANDTCPEVGARITWESPTSMSIPRC